MAHRLLLADDSLTIQKVVELTFSESEYEILTVGNGDKAVEAIGSFHPDVVLADAVMPGLSGYEVCEAVKRLPHGATIPVLLLTGTFEPFDRARADRAGCDAIVTKPFDSHALAAQVKELVEKAQAARQASPTVAMPAFAPEPAAAFDDIDLDRPDALYATTALRIPSPDELERIAREEAQIRSMASSAEPTPLFELSEPAPAVQIPGSPEAMEYETTAPLEPLFAPPGAGTAPAAEEIFGIPAGSEPETAEALEEAEAAEEEESAQDRFDSTVPMPGRAPRVAAEPKVAEEAASEVPETLETEPPFEEVLAFPDAPILVESIVAEPFDLEPPPGEAVPSSAYEPVAEEPLGESAISVEPLMEEPFGAAEERLDEAPSSLGSNVEPEHGDIVEAIAAYERASFIEAPAFGPETGELEEGSANEAIEAREAKDAKEAEVSELEELASRSRLDDLKALIPQGAGEAPRGALSPEQVDAIARRVVELLGEKVVREVAWEVVPELAERLVRARLQELEGA